MPAALQQIFLGNLYHPVTITNADSSFTLLGVTDAVVFANTTGGVILIRLPNVGLTVGQMITIKNIGNPGSVCQVQGNGNTIDTQAAVNIGVSFGSIQVMWNGNEWSKIGPLV